MLHYYCKNLNFCLKLVKPNCQKRINNGMPEIIQITILNTNKKCTNLINIDNNILIINIIIKQQQAIRKTTFLVETQSFMLYSDHLLTTTYNFESQSVVFLIAYLCINTLCLQHRALLRPVKITLPTFLPIENMLSGFDADQFRAVKIKTVVCCYFEPFLLDMYIY